MRSRTSLWATRLGAFVAGALFVLLFTMSGATCRGDREDQRADTATRPGRGEPASHDVPAPAWAQPGSDGSGSAATIADVASKVTPGVVNLSARRLRSVALPEGLPADPFFRRFFGGPDSPFGAIPRERVEQALGSGVIISGEGIILTNHHLVEAAESIQVETSDHRTLDATIMGSDPPSDLAVLRVKGNGLPALSIGDSSKLRVGDLVLAVGDPFGLGGTVTMGIISAVGRAEMGITDYEDFLQTDAAINPGNSGGALVNLRGELIGINTAIVSRTGGSMGIGFAIPSNMAKAISDALREHGRVSRGWLGVGIQDVTPELAQGLGIDEATRGAVVTQVVPDGPAARAGIQQGDVIVQVGDRRIESATALSSLIASLGPNARARVQVMRGRQRLQLEPTLAERPADVGRGRAQEPTTVPEGGTLGGVTVAQISPEARERFSIPGDVRGVVATDVEPTSPAARAGLREGDVIVQVNRTPVTTPQEFQRAAQGAAESVLLLVSRGGNSLFLAWR